MKELKQRAKEVRDRTPVVNDKADQKQDWREKCYTAIYCVLMFLCGILFSQFVKFLNGM